MTSKPYIGVTGVSSIDEVKAVVQEFNNAGLTINSHHLPMLGYLVSFKTLNSIPTLNLRYPRFNELYGLIGEACNNALTMIHYNSREQSTLNEQVSKIFDKLYFEGLCRALQLNTAWPEINQLAMIKNKFPEMKIVLQMQSSDIYHEPFKDVAKKAKKYSRSVDYMLIDPSGGSGVKFDIGTSLDIYQMLKEEVPKTIIGFAGGFTGDNVRKRLDRISSKLKTTEFCIDAEGGLRDKLSGDYGDDLLNIEKVKAYIQAASGFLKEQLSLKTSK